MKNYAKALLIFGLILFAFAIGMFVGEKKVISHQQVKSENQTYIVTYEGHDYIYY